MRMIKNKNKNNEQFNFFEITTYHFKEKADDRSNVKNELSSRQETNDYEVDEIKIIKYYES